MLFVMPRMKYGQDEPLHLISVRVDVVNTNRVDRQPTKRPRQAASSRVASFHRNNATRSGVQSHIQRPAASSLQSPCDKLDGGQQECLNSSEAPSVFHIAPGNRYKDYLQRLQMDLDRRRSVVCENVIIWCVAIATGEERPTGLIIQV